MNLSHLFFFAAIVAMLSVVAVMFIGMLAMTKDGANNRQRSNKMMQLRVILQGVTILCLFLAWAAS